MEDLLRPMTTRTSPRPARAHSSTTYWIAGLSTTGSISFGDAFVAGRNLVPSPAAGITAFVTAMGRTLMGGSLNAGRRREPPGVAAGVLGVVQRLIGLAQQRPRRGAVGREDGGTDRHGHLDLLLRVVAEGSPAHRVADPLGDLHGPRLVRLGEDHNDL